MAAKWAQTLIDRTATVHGAVDAAREAIAEANRVKVAALDDEEKRIRWAITSIWNYDTQHALNEALTAARAARDQECADLNTDLAIELQAVLDAWDATTAAEQDDLNANTERSLQTCDAAKQAQTALLDAWKTQ